VTWISGCKPLKLNPINLLHYFFFYKTLNFDNKSINSFLSILRIKRINGSYWCYSQTQPRVFLTLRIAEILIQLSKYPTLSAIVVKELVHKCFFFFFGGGGGGGGGGNFKETGEYLHLIRMLIYIYISPKSYDMH
jgi:hypothetical protein